MMMVVNGGRKSRNRGVYWLNELDEEKIMVMEVAKVETGGFIGLMS
jgi:hypothetical protein